MYGGEISNLEEPSRAGLKVAQFKSRASKLEDRVLGAVDLRAKKPTSPPGNGGWHAGRFLHRVQSQGTCHPARKVTRGESVVQCEDCGRILVQER